MNLRTDNIDVPALRALLIDTAAQIRAVKSQLRTTWTRPMHREQRELWALKDKATLLCILRAYVRGRYHLRAPRRRGRSPDVEWNQERVHRTAAARAAERYDLYFQTAPVAERPNQVDRMTS